jgi:two-component sensor histidine kinase
MRLIFFFIIIFLYTFSLWANNDTSSLEKQYEIFLKKGMDYSNVSLYTESAREYDKACVLAKEHGWEEKYINASISLAELMRKTRNFQKGFEILYSLNNTEKYPSLHVRKLGRLAALYQESSNPEHLSYLDSAKITVEKALKQAKEINLTKEMASLYNEYGFLLYRYEHKKKEGVDYFLKSADLYNQLKDTQNYASVLTHILEYYHNINAFLKFDSLQKVIFNMIKNKKWYTLQIDLYSTIAANYGKQGDSLSYYKWKTKEKTIITDYLQASHTTQMNEFKIIHESEKLKHDIQKAQVTARQKEKELKLETEKLNELRIYLIILGIMILAFILLLIRERKLKKEIALANKKYQMLMKESNHRIKNNLQMIISMLQYSGKDLDSKSKKTLKRISDKIHTISTLHKHLYIDTHNERVNIKFFFNEIIKLYDEMSHNNLSIHAHFDNAFIKSERIIYFGLILNEMIANTIEHHKDKNKIIHISITKKENNFLYFYKDNSSYHIKNENGIGIQLITQLIKRIEAKNFAFNPENGEYTFEFEE